MAKRLFDVAAALAALAVLSPLLVFAAAAVKASSPGPVLFRQERIGRDGVPFHIFKFRTMYHGGAGGGLVTAAGDERITRVGHWLRRLKIDELPQLINVLRGEMSLVGPRPEVGLYVELWPADARHVILSVRPGITDPASIKFRREGDILAQYQDPESAYRTVVMPEKVALYVAYVRTAGFWSDLKIIIKTLYFIGR